MANLDIEDVVLKKFEFSRLREWIAITVSIATTIFWVGYAFASYVTSDELDRRINVLRIEISQQNKEILTELKILNSQAASLTAGKVDKPNVVLKGKLYQNEE